ncbi:MAG: flagellar biosynthesis anti-sigma factor FlgM [Aquificaceae bacterium]
MIDRVELQRVLSYSAELEERKRRQTEEKSKEEEVRVELSQGLRGSRQVDYEDLSKKVEDIRQQLERGTYEVSPEKVLKGLEKFLFSK